MKWIIYLFLLANISFFAWHYQAVDRDDRQTQAEQQNMMDGAVRLVMLKEAQRETDVESSQSAKTSLPQCRSLGPFKKRKQAKKVDSLLQKQGVQLSLRVNKEAKRKGYWVYLLPAKSSDAARQTARKLKKKHRIKDLFIVATGEKKNAISLGVFSKFELAYRRQDEIRKLGFDVQLNDVKLPVKEYWLDWPQELAGELSNKQMRAVKEVNDSVVVAKVDCRR